MRSSPFDCLYPSGRLVPARGRLRFAFYWRVATEDYQDPASSRLRQRDQAGALVAGHGRIVAEFFDVGQSRVLPWPRRPQAAALLAAMADPDCGFDAIRLHEGTARAMQSIFFFVRQITIVEQIYQA